MADEYETRVKAIFRPRLEKDLEDAIAAAASPTAGVATVMLDQQSVGRLSRIDALQSQAMAQAIERRLHVQRLRLERALQRMNEGDFGYCSECGEPIGLRRLHVDPAAHLCVDCAP
ncbi:TraR/DksA C4-type zinc finger protein [Ancylobacter sp. TS-1]|uniref:TraR/DksA family transcriptional regulator n=1 Tax=Ancylobacter sp. TS-1 TaxID=1850374 RepID=UPI001265B73B|nr:TraR/DksA C4-type zinc finger protein [Ancylobacter sp. TS-1]QFR34692.1 TraR/DksA family transcriptional regulator [Ancylobacter sp. TS-1]